MINGDEVIKREEIEKEIEEEELIVDKIEMKREIKNGSDGMMRGVIKGNVEEEELDEEVMIDEGIGEIVEVEILKVGKMGKGEEMEVVECMIEIDVNKVGKKVDNIMKEIEEIGNRGGEEMKSEEEKRDKIRRIMKGGDEENEWNRKKRSLRVEGNIRKNVERNRIERREEIEEMDEEKVDGRKGRNSVEIERKDGIDSIDEWKRISEIGKRRKGRIEDIGDIGSKIGDKRNKDVLIEKFEENEEILRKMKKRWKNEEIDNEVREEEIELDKVREGLIKKRKDRIKWIIIEGKNDRGDKWEVRKENFKIFNIEKVYIKRKVGDELYIVEEEKKKVREVDREIEREV